MPSSVSHRVSAEHLLLQQNLVKAFDGRYTSNFRYINGVEYSVTVSFENVRNMFEYEEAFARLTTPIVEKVRKLPWHRKVIKFLTCNR